MKNTTRSLKVWVVLEHSLGAKGSTYEQWKSITDRMRAIVLDVRQLSTEGQAYVDDVLNIMGDYLCFSKEGTHSEERELREYKAESRCLGQ